MKEWLADGLRRLADWLDPVPAEWITGNLCAQCYSFGNCGHRTFTSVS